MRLVGAMGELGGGVFQLVQDPPIPEDRPSFDRRLLDLAVSSGVAVAIAATGASIPQSLNQLDMIAAAGGRSFALTHSRGIGSMSSFATKLPFDSLPEWRKVRSLSQADQQRMLRDPEVCRTLVWAAHHGSYAEAVGAEARLPDFERMEVVERPVPPNPTVADAARDRGVDPVQYMIDSAIECFDRFYFQSFSPFDADVVRLAMKHPRTVMTFSDAGAHVSQISDCSIQTHLLAHWVRDRGDFTLEEAIRMLTLAPARAWGFADRGLLREGMVADLNVFDPDTVSPNMPTVVHDLPRGGPAHHANCHRVPRHRGRGPGRPPQRAAHRRIARGAPATTRYIDMTEVSLKAYAPAPGTQ